MWSVRVRKKPEREIERGEETINRLRPTMVLHHSTQVINGRWRFRGAAAAATTAARNRHFAARNEKRGQVQALLNSTMNAIHIRHSTQCEKCVVGALPAVGFGCECEYELRIRETWVWEAY